MFKKKLSPASAVLTLFLLFTFSPISHAQTEEFPGLNFKEAVPPFVLERGIPEQAFIPMKDRSSYQHKEKQAKTPSGHDCTGVHMVSEASQREIIHLTDFLYRTPEIKEAYEAYLHLKEKAPEQLMEMQDVTDYQIGDTRNFKVYNLERSSGVSAVFDDIRFELRAIGDKSEVWVEQDEIGPNKINQGVIDSMIEALETRTPEHSVNPDQGIILNNIDIFAGGDASLVPDPDGSGRVKVLVADIQDGYDPAAGISMYVAGFFMPGDLAPRSQNPNSNQAAILYINSNPGIYSRYRGPDVTRSLSTIAHEHQHLIQAGSGNLMTFMDEGQSEVAEIFNGFNARAMTFLNVPDEVKGSVGAHAAGGFFRWRHGEAEVIYDYQRAQLFHSYLYERVGVEAVGSLTQSQRGDPWQQYQDMLDASGKNLDFREILSDFYSANWLNDTSIANGEFGYTLPQFRDISVLNPARYFDGGARPWIKNEKIRLQYGSAKYTNWRYVEDLSVQLDAPSGTRHTLFYEDESGNRGVVPLENDRADLSGLFRWATLSSVNTTVASPSNYGHREYLYTAEWNSTNMHIEQVIHSGDIRFFFGIPFTSTVNPSQQIRGFSTRIDPPRGGDIKRVDFMLYRNPIDTGTLRISITKSEQVDSESLDSLWVPTESVLASKEVSFDDLAMGDNFVSFREHEITLEPKHNYHIVYKVIPDTPDAELQFLIDSGSEDKSNRNYFPIRTLISIYDLIENKQTGWSYFIGDDEDPTDNAYKNFLSSYHILTPVPEIIEYPEMVVSDDFELLPNYPNPFNEGTNIQINVPVSVEKTTEVTLEVYDILGRRVAVLLQEELSAGLHTIPFNAGNLSSGIYLARLQAGGTADVNKMTLIR